MAKLKNPSMNLGTMAGGFRKMENSLGRDAAGNARYEMDDAMRPTIGTLPNVDVLGKKPQTPLQHDAVKKAAAASVAKRRVAAGLPSVAPLGVNLKKRLPRI